MIGAWQYFLISTSPYSFVRGSVPRRLSSIPTGYPSTLVFDIHLAELVPVRGDGADLPNSVLGPHPVEEVVDPLRRGLLERIVWVDVHHLAVSKKTHW